MANAAFHYESPNVFRTLAHNLKWNTIQLINEFHDRRLGIEAQGIIAADRLESPGPNAARWHVYQGTPHSVLSIIFRTLKIDHSRFTFVDLGSGKGRVVARAAALPFAKVLGVELSPMLHEAAQRNIAGSRGVFASRIELLNEDVTRFTVPNGPLVVFNFNGFNESLLGECAAWLQDSLDEKPRECWFVYLNPKYDETLRRVSRFERQSLPSIVGPQLRLLSPWPLAIYRQGA
jgi:SAM-dependent methyltransferase